MHFLHFLQHLKLEENCHNNHSHTEGKWSLINDISSGFKDADAILILTEWAEFSNIDWKYAYKTMRKPGWVFDSRSIVNPKEVIEANLKFWRIGDGT